VYSLVCINEYPVTISPFCAAAYAGRYACLQRLFHNV
jgi:hypothetical protein